MRFAFRLRKCMELSEHSSYHTNTVCAAVPPLASMPCSSHTEPAAVLQLAFLSLFSGFLVCSRQCAGQQVAATRCTSLPQTGLLPSKQGGVVGASHHVCLDVLQCLNVRLSLRSQVHAERPPMRAMSGSMSSNALSVKPI